MPHFFVPVSPWLLDACEIRIPTRDTIPRAVWCTRIQHGRLIHAHYSWYQPHYLRFRQHKLLLLVLFPASTSSTWNCVYSLKESGWKKTSKDSWCWTNEEDDSTHHGWSDLQSTCQRVGFWCQCIWFGFRGPSWSYQTTKSNATLWVLDACLIVGLLPFRVNFDHSLIVFKKVPPSFKLKRFCACDNVTDKTQFINFSVAVSRRFGGGVGALGNTVRSIPRHLTGVLHFSTVIFHCLLGVLGRMPYFDHHIAWIESRDSIRSQPSIQRERTSDSVELWDTEVCFLQIHSSWEQIFDDDTWDSTSPKLT